MVVSLVTGDVGWPIYLILGWFGGLGWVRCLVAWGVGLFPVLWLLELLVLLICGLFDSGDRLCALGFWFVWFGGVVSLLAALLVVVVV